MNKKASRVRELPAVADETMFLLMHAAGTIEKRLEDALGGVGLSLAKFGALTFLVRAGEPLSLSECAAKMTCVRSNITQLVDRLEADGLAVSTILPTAAVSWLPRRPWAWSGR
jgi:DNA-binding MarR family transcriptional regulator